MAKKEDKDEVLKLSDAESMLGIHHMTLMKYIWDGRFPAFKNENGHWRVKKSDLSGFKETFDKSGGNKPGKKTWEGASSVKNTIKISQETAKKIAILAIQEDTTPNALVEKAIDTMLASYKTKKRSSTL